MDRLGAHAAHLVELNELGNVICDIGDVIELGRDPNDVLAIQGRDECLVEALEDLVGQLVA
jgi:hypothetical protein